MPPIRRHSLLDPATLAAVADLGLAARRIVDGTMFGVHASRIPGSGLEFSQYRSYQPGDDLRRVDWKLFGRSDRYFVRESESETSVTVRIVVDATGSMGETVEPGGISTLDYARLVVAALACLADRQGDAVGLVTLADGNARLVPPRRDPQQSGRVLRALEGLRPAGQWPAWERLEPLMLGGADGRRGITVLVSDGREHAAEIRAAAARLAAVRHDLLLVHLVGRAELEFPFEGAVLFEDLESGRRVEVDAGAARAAYLAGAARDHAALREAALGRGVQYERIATSEPLDAALVRVLRARARLARR